MPRGLLHRLMNPSVVRDEQQGDRKAVEYAAMKAVMDIEASLGYIPRDVSGEKCG